ncbi:ABC transporter permease [Pseudoclavibacter endophyticus]|uniref:ABC transporter permease n=1 Tax=Pseudoclavibacter endophyticus TaxID=1778590 RepID=UPI001CE3C393|nr:ABC transporter permease [Pseudoclavibacter endophyticus]
MTTATTAAPLKLGRQVNRVLISVIVPIAILVAWWVVSLGSTSPFFPPLRDIMVRLGEDWLLTRVVTDVFPSLLRMFAGFAIALVIGVGLGAVLGRQPLVARALNPVLQFGRALPATALVPVSIVLMGIGDTPKIALIAFVTVFPVMLNTIDGVRNVDLVLEDVCGTYRLTRKQRLLNVQLPAAGPQILAGMRIALSVAFVMMVVTELVAATNGIGYVTLQAQQNFHVTLMWSGMLLLGILGVLINGLFILVERRMLRWYKQDSGE